MPDSIPIFYEDGKLKSIFKFALELKQSKLSPKQKEVCILHYAQLVKIVWNERFLGRLKNII